MNGDDLEPASSCCDSAAACVFAKALFARSAQCALARRRAIAEREVIECPSPVARMNCRTLEQLLRERARFVLKLHAGTPLMHAQALRLQCGGLQGLQQALDAPTGDVHQLVGLAHERHGSLTDLPWDRVVQTLVQWQPRARRRPAAP
jgi:hypothetical protein